MGLEMLQETELRVPVKEFLEATGFSDQMFQYFVQRGLNTYEERPKGQFRPIRYVTVPDLARFIVNNYRLDLLPRIGIPLHEYIAKGSWRPPPLPERWSVSEIAHFLRVPESVVHSWNDIGALEGTHEDGLLWFDTSALSEFLGLTPEEIALSLPQTFTLKEVREMAVPTDVQMPAGDADFGSDIHQVPFIQVLTRNIGEFVPHRGTLIRFSKLYILDVLLNQGLARWLVGLRSVKSLRQYVLDQIVGGGKVRFREPPSGNGASSEPPSAPLFADIVSPVKEAAKDTRTETVNEKSIPYRPITEDALLPLRAGRLLIPAGLVPVNSSSHHSNPTLQKVMPMDQLNPVEHDGEAQNGAAGGDVVATIETTIRQAIKEAADGQLSRVGARLFAILELLEKSPEAQKAIRDLPASPRATVPEEPVEKREEAEPAAVASPKTVRHPPREPSRQADTSEISSLKGLFWERRGDFVVRILTDLKGRKYEQRCTVDEFRAILLELKKYAGSPAKLFSTGQIIRALGWNKSNRFKVHLVAFVLAGKDQIRVLGRGKASRFQITASENDLERTLQEVLAPPEE
jgi:hypothetical protein